MNAQDDEIRSTVEEFGRANAPDSAAISVLRGCIRLAGAERGRMYFFDLASGKYMSFVHDGRSERSSGVVHPLKSNAIRPPPPIELAVLKREAVYTSRPTTHQDEMARTGTYESRLIIPVLRGNSSCIAVVDIDWSRSGALTNPEALCAKLRPLLSLIPHIYGWQFRRTLLEQIQAPIIFDQPEANFLRDVRDLIMLASQMEYFVLREYDADADELHTLAEHGFSAGPDLSDLDLPTASELSGFNSAMETREPYAASSMRPPEYQRLRAIPRISAVKSFVACPVIIGRDLFGVLSFGSSVEYEYSYDEIAGLQSVANGIGLSILNFRHFHAAKEEVAKFQDVGTAITAMEVAQAARHEGRGLLADISTDALLTKRLLNTKPPKVTDAIGALVSVERSAISLNDVLDKIKAASKIPDQKKLAVSLKEVWEEARKQLSGRLHVAGVSKISYKGPEVEVFVAPDWFRQVFINLILNSCDAFVSNSTPKNGRSIQLIVDKDDLRSNRIVARYVDNAGGINFSSLHRADGETVTDAPEKAIFEPNVTSKPDGSGWGLALVRRIVRQHNGNIVLLEHRSRTVFRLELSKEQASTGNQSRL